MLHVLVIRPEARICIQEIYWYYEGQQSGLGERFLLELNKRFDDLERQPNFYSFIDDKKILRDVKLSVFPYRLVFDIQDSIVTVYFLVHTASGMEF